MMNVSGSWRAAAAARSFPACSSAGITFLPSMWPQRFGDCWSSRKIADAPIASYAWTTRVTFLTSPYALSASTSTGSEDAAIVSRMTALFSPNCARSRSG